MGGNLAFSGVTGLRIFYLSNREGLAVLLAEVVLRELIDPIDVELTAECLNAVSGLELITGPVVVTNVFQPWLSNVKVFREALSLKKHGKVITPIVVVMDLSHFSGVVSEEVVDDVGQVVKATEEPQNASIVVEELLLAFNTAASERFFHVLFQTGVMELFLGDLSVRKAV